MDFTKYKGQLKICIGINMINLGKTLQIIKIKRGQLTLSLQHASAPGLPPDKNSVDKILQFSFFIFVIRICFVTLNRESVNPNTGMKLNWSQITEPGVIQTKPEQIYGLCEGGIRYLNQKL